VDLQILAIGNSDARRFLAAMLQCENAKESAARHFDAWRENAEDAAFFLWPVFGMI
jgi:hypothetical protein